MENMGKDLTDYMNRQKLNQQFNKLVEDALNDSDVQAFIQANKDRLSQETVTRSAAKIYEYVIEKKKLANGQTTLAPGYAPKLVLNKPFYRCQLWAYGKFITRARTSCLACTSEVN